MRPVRALVFAACLAFAVPAQARSQQDLAYQYDVVWNAAVRLVRVEMGLSIDEKDLEAGFLLFGYVDHDRTYPGSVELVRPAGPRDPVSVIVHVGGMPSYVEHMILEKLGRKLEREYGAPVEPPPPAPAKPPADEPEPPADAPPEGD